VSASRQAQQLTGKIVVGGSVGIRAFERSAVLARFKANGATDSGSGGFGNVVKGKVTSL
jgi:hypothetical protein